MDQNDDDISYPPESYAHGLNGEVGTLSRLGDEYQTEIPLLLTDSEFLDYIENPMKEEVKKEILPSDFLIGLDIPVVWISQKKQDPEPDLTSELKNDSVVLAPGRALEPWSKMEKGSFVLGLYIFGKDFVRLKRFIESKKMGEIMSFYYGSFYKSDRYKRWSDCRKGRVKKCILGQRIFSGVRQQEFLCRLFPRVSEECQNSLLEVCRTFGDGRISFEQYVTSLKTLIGIQFFIDAVAIGKGNRDLTGKAIEPTKQNQAIRIRPELPIGKACSSLTAAEIIQFLTGDFRLSKGRSNDLFWEAVWPRLLARGWHSEQPNGCNYAANGKNSLVFLFPGVKKYSRKLTKGDGYLDSVTDVLNKVASDPQLLELGNEENGETVMKFEKNEKEEENGHVEKRKSHCYLQPRAPNLNPIRGTAVMKFTVVDTSLRGGKIIRVRELDTVKLVSRSRTDDEIHSELVSSDDDSDGANTFLDYRQNPGKKQKTTDERKILEKKHVKTANGSDSNTMKAKPSRKSSQENSGNNAKRRRRLSACSRLDSKPGSSLDSHMGSSSQANDNHKLSSNLSFTSRYSSIDTAEEQEMNLIDLNYPPEFNNVESVTETADVKDERNGPGPQKEPENIAVVKEQDKGGSRRQGTRNRPPTARVLEAFANGYLTFNTRKIDKEGHSVLKSTSTPNTPHGEPAIVSEHSTGDASSAVKGDNENDEFEK